LELVFSDVVVAEVKGGANGADELGCSAYKLEDKLPDNVDWLALSSALGGVFGGIFTTDELNRLAVFGLGIFT
jgi:hypothetical protein